MQSPLTALLQILQTGASLDAPDQRDLQQFEDIAAGKAGHGPLGPCVALDQPAPQPLDPAAPVPLRSLRRRPARRATARHLLLSPHAAHGDLTRRLLRQQRGDASNRGGGWSRGVAARRRSRFQRWPDSETPSPMRPNHPVPRRTRPSWNVQQPYGISGIKSRH
jgi:hypothetical protein